jgi:hypothetical protein
MGVVEVFFATICTNVSDAQKADTAKLQSLDLLRGSVGPRTKPLARQWRFWLAFLLIPDLAAF